MKKNLLILPGYLVGIGSLLLITYRTFLAFFSQSKSITINVNRYGEQYGDIAVLVFIWIVCVMGLYSLFILMKEQKSENVFPESIQAEKISNEDKSFLNDTKKVIVSEKTNTVITFRKPLEESNRGFPSLDEHGNRIVTSDSLKTDNM